MKRIKDLDKINQALENGQTFYLDYVVGHKYSLCALCPNDDNECSVTSFEKGGGEASRIKRVTFYCPICGNRFDASPGQMFLW